MSCLVKPGVRDSISVGGYTNTKNLVICEGLKQEGVVLKYILVPVHSQKKRNPLGLPEYMQKLSENNVLRCLKILALKLKKKKF